MRKGTKPQSPSYWVQLLYEQVERARAERDEGKEPGKGAEGD